MPLSVAWNFTVLPASLLGAIVFGIGDFEFLLFPGAQAAQILGEGREGVRAADLEHHFVGLHRVAFDAGQAFEGHHGMIAILHRARIDVDVLRLLLADLFDALVDVLFGDFGIAGRGLRRLRVLAQFDFREPLRTRP